MVGFGHEQTFRAEKIDLSPFLLGALLRRPALTRALDRLTGGCWLRLG